MKYLALILLILLLCVDCSQEAPVATVGGQQFYSRDIRRYCQKQCNSGFAELSDQEKLEATRNMVSEYILEKNSDLLNSKLAQISSISQETLLDYYELNKSRYIQPVQTRVQILALKDSLTAARVFEQARQGESFESLIRDFHQKSVYGDDPISTTFLCPDDQYPIGEKAAAMEVDEIFGPMKYEDGFVILKTVDRLPEKQIGFEESFLKLKEDYHKQKADSIRSLVVSVLWDSLEVNIHEENLVQAFSK